MRLGEPVRERGDAFAPWARRAKIERVKVEDAGKTLGAAQVDALIDARNAARAAKNFGEADRIRDELAAMGIELKDARDPKTGELVTTWEVAR